MHNIPLLLKRFLGYILCYHLLNTLMVHGLGRVSLGVFSVSKDFFFLIIACIAVYIQKNKLAQTYMLYKNHLFMIASIFVVFLGVSRWQGISFDMILVGIKYDLWWMIVLLVGMLLGVNKQIGEREVLRRSVYILSVTIIFGMLRQCGKIFFPDFFTQWGYGAIGDYVLGSHPPLRYRTGPGGMMRFSGIFAGPNNLGYMMVAFFPVIFWSLFFQKNKRIYIYLTLAMMLTVIATFSRGAMGIMFVQAIIIYRYLYSDKRIYIYMLFACGCVAGAGLLAFKRGSTVEHLARFLGGFQVMLAHPFGLGLGMSGPSVHYKGIYLPENQRLQRAIDGGILGLCLIIRYIYTLFSALDFKNSAGYAPLFFLGFFGLLAEGMVLHTFEDSMVTYIFFLLFGIILGGSMLVKLNLQKTLEP